VKQNDLGEYEENVKEKQNIQYTRQNTNSPSNQDIWMANTNSSSQISKSRRIKGFGENVGQLSLDVYISHLNVHLLYMISQKVVSSQHVLSFCERLDFLATEMALVLSHMRESLSNLTPKSLIVCTIQRISEQQLHTRPRWWTVQLKTIFEKNNKQEKTQENDK
jgi:hypothetical protein